MRLYNCERCYRRKSKCDRLRPCSNCARANADCVYSGHPPQRPNKRRRRAASSDDVTVTATPERPPDDSRARADVVSEISYLNLQAGGEPQGYLGSSSGLLLADLINSRVDATVTRAGTPRSGIESNATASVSHPRRDDELPPENAAMALVRAYLNHDAIAYPFILPSFLLQTVDRFYRELNYYSSNATAFEAFTFNMVLAIATSRVQKGRPPLDTGPVGYNARAMRDVGALFASGNIECLQTLLLLCQYRLSSPIRDNSVGMWHLIGFAVRLCFELGLHRESSYTIASVHESSPAEIIAKFQEQETRRRCFWTLVSMDRIVSLVLGRPFGIHDDDISTELPRELEAEESIMAHGHEFLGVLRISLSNKICRYRMLCGQLSQRTQGKRFETASSEEIARLTQTLADSINEWHQSSPQLATLRNIDHDRDTLSCYLSQEWFDLLAANASLMLWRPHLLLPELGHNPHVLDRILAAASSAISIYENLHRARKINYNWITLQAVFLAGLSYVSTITQHFRQRLTSTAATAPILTQDPFPAEVVRITRACSKVLVALSERWDLPPHCHEVFDRLSDVAVQDAIQYHTTTSAVATSEDNALSSRAGDSISSDFESSYRGASGWPYGGFGMANADEFLSFLYDQQYLSSSDMDLSQDWLGPLDHHAGF